MFKYSNLNPDKLQLLLEIHITIYKWSFEIKYTYLSSYVLVSRPKTFASIFHVVS